MQGRFDRSRMGGYGSKNVDSRERRDFVHVELDGKSLLLPVARDDTFFVLKRKLQAKTGVDPSSLCAYYKGIKRMDFLLLADAGVKSGERIQMERLPKQNEEGQRADRRTTVEPGRKGSPQDEEKDEELTSETSEEDEDISEDDSKESEEAASSAEIEGGEENEEAKEEMESVPFVDEKQEAEALLSLDKIHKDVDQLEGDVRSANTEFDFGGNVDLKALLLLEELLMKKILLLDGIDAPGKARDKRKQEIVRIQGLCSIVDELKERLAWQ